MTNKKRSLLKTLTWRITATTTTLILVYLTTGTLNAAGLVAGFEIIVKTTLYYFHERTWEKSDKKFYNKNNKTSKKAS